MADQKTDEQQAANSNPIFRLQKMYVKDLSFENPNAPQVFFQKDTEPSVEMNLEMKNRKLDEDHWEITLALTAKVTDAKSKATLFIIEVEHAGAFMIKNIPSEHLPAVLGVECPMLLFPFTRQIISQASVDGGFVPFLMEPVNFLALFQKAQQEKAQQKQ